VVSVVRRFNPEISTLSIGDGANDVSMITAAHVGVGIKGVEGQQAARASDYAVGEFKMLRPLLFVHGRECYRKNSLLVLYNFFKNIIMVFPQFWFSIYNNFSGQTPYDSFIYQLFNVFYTSLPIIIFAVFDEEHSRKKLFENKQNYYRIGL
jgi:phospholipid-transporting ATPase